MLKRLKVFVKAQFSAFTGGICDYFIMIFLTELIGVYYAVSIAISCILGAVVNFSLNKKWSFYSKETGYRFSLPQQLRRFFLVVVSSIILKIVGTYCITTFAHIDYKISRIIADIIVSLCFNYVLQRYWVFRNVRLTILSLFVCNTLYAQTDIIHPSYLEINDLDSISELLDRQPSFGMYKDNYITTGVPVNREINKYTADVKFQLSIRQRLTKTVLPYNTFLMLTYTQKSFWDVYVKSAPFRDSNYNPGLILVKPVIHRNYLYGIATFAFEHESNGRDSLDSRGWNYFVLSGVYFFNANFSVQTKIWAGWLDKGDDDLEGGGNTDLYKYRGHGLLAFNYRSLNDKFWLSAIINPRSKFGRFNTQLELNFKSNPKANQYLFIQWYNGYGDSLLDYNKYTSMLRIGFCIKPPMRNFY